MFQFPSNGKVYPKQPLADDTEEQVRVFQFPSNGKVYPKGAMNTILLLKTGKFQFHTNGNVYPKCLELIRDDAEDDTVVSIPFKREGVSIA